MKTKYFVISLCIILICLFSLYGCFKYETQQLTKNEKQLYNWLLENGELVNGTGLMYQDNAFTLHTNHSQKIFVNYVIPDYNGCKVIVQFPLFSESENSSTSISVQSNDSSTSLIHFHTAKDFTKKSPIEYGDMNSYPPLVPITLDDYGTFKEENGKLVFCLDENKREEYEQINKINEEISAQQGLCENVAKELAHETLCDILDWLNEEICPLVKMDISDLGYTNYD